MSFTSTMIPYFILCIFDTTALIFNRVTHVTYNSGFSLSHKCLVKLHLYFLFDYFPLGAFNNSLYQVSLSVRLLTLQQNTKFFSSVTTVLQNLWAYSLCLALPSVYTSKTYISPCHRQFKLLHSTRTKVELAFMKVYQFHPLMQQAIFTMIQ